MSTITIEQARAIIDAMGGGGRETSLDETSRCYWLEYRTVYHLTPSA